MRMIIIKRQGPFMEEIFRERGEREREREREEREEAEARG